MEIINLWEWMEYQKESLVFLYIKFQDYIEVFQKWNLLIHKLWNSSGLKVICKVIMMLIIFHALNKSLISIKIHWKFSESNSKIDKLWIRNKAALRAVSESLISFNKKRRKSFVLQFFVSLCWILNNSSTFTNRDIKNTTNFFSRVSNGFELINTHQYSAFSDYFVTSLSANSVLF